MNEHERKGTRMNGGSQDTHPFPGGGGGAKTSDWRERLHSLLRGSYEFLSRRFSLSFLFLFFPAFRLSFIAGN